jgi:hypothetical protein
MARFQFPNNVNSLSKEHLADYISTHFKERICEKSAGSDEGSQYCVNPSTYTFDLNEGEKKKHEFYETCAHRAVAVPNGNSWTVQPQVSEIEKRIDVIEGTHILENLTRDDIQHLIETEDELSQSHG